MFFCIRRKGMMIITAALATILLILGIVYYFVSAHIAAEAALERYQIPLLPHVRNMYSMKRVREAPKEITSTVFMLRGDFSSDFYDLFALQKRATRYCDNDTKADGCDVKLPRSYRWGTLSSKLVDALELMCKEPVKTDFYAKIDDDLIMSESKFDDALRVMAETDCQVSGGIARDYGFYWPLGQIYIFKRAILEKICARFPVTISLPGSEDISFGKLINSTDRDMFCNLHGRDNHWHRQYKDDHLRIKYYKQQNH
ncbi:hypothetical protein EV177_004322 [Coemansia sp. RSA 1804]|nr:hypothetical protein EV177_004322 [Coemansia sp. RSA 1804]